MWMNREDARSDAILAGATTLFGTSVVALVSRLPFYPRTGPVGTLFDLVWLFALTGLVPYLLTRHRRLGADSYGLGTGRSGLAPGLLLAAPIVVAGIARGLPVQGSVLAALLGRFSPVLGDGPTVVSGTTSAGNALVEGVVALATVALLAVGALLLYGFLTVRGRDAFARRDLSTTEAVRTFGMGAAGVALVLGLLRSIGDGMSPLSVLINVVALVAVVLLGDRLIPAEARTTRPAVLTPVVVAAVAHVLGVLRVDPLFGLYAAALAAGLVAVLASVIEGRHAAWAVIPPVVAMAVYPTCLTVLPFGTSAFGC